MAIETLIAFLVWFLFVFIIAWACFYLIQKFVPEPFRTPGLLIVGVIVLIAVLYALVGVLPGRLPSIK